ncbi:glycoside hydrolase family 2 TIM barrel-domain containing protein [Bacteroidota bacterium]
MKNIYVILLVSSILTLTACNSNKEDKTNMKPSKVELKFKNDVYRLYVDNKEFYVKGAGCECWDIPSLAAHGANSFRTWMDSEAHRDGLEMLDEAHEYGLKILMGIKVGRERHGFDYDDEQAVATQFEEIKKTVMLFKDHPALLGWGIGNELNLRAANLKVWDAVNDISKMIHEIDGNHPTTTMLAGIGKRDIDYMESIDIDLDFISIQMYGDIVNLQTRIDEADYDGPYMVTEWGATGHWEMPSTEWGAAIEQTSTEKAKSIIERYKSVIKADNKNCLGSYVFLWGQKQERTPTWYGLFTENGEEMEAISAMHYLWNGKWPEDRIPEIVSASLDGKGRFDNIRLSAGKKYTASIESNDPDGDPLTLRTEILLESNDLRDGGDLESRPDRVNASISDLSDGKFTITAPIKPGPYRLFFYVLDGHNHAATVNIPFFVD